MTPAPRVLAYAGTHPPFPTHMSFPPPVVLAGAGIHHLPDISPLPPFLLPCYPPSMKTFLLPSLVLADAGTHPPTPHSIAQLFSNESHA